MWCCQGCVCAGTVFPNTVWNGLLALKEFPKYIYVKIVDNLVFSLICQRFVVV